MLDSKRRTAKYRYVGEIACYWVDFEELVGRARFAGDDEHLELLQAALALVRGQPFGAGSAVGPRMHTAEHAAAT